MTNVVVLSALDVERHFAEILQRDLPIASLPAFLHEATHHWCFDSPVGIALHVLFIRARRSALRVLSKGARSDDGWDVLDDVVRYEWVRDIIRPLSEGIALFAEHDAVPGNARTISAPLVRAGGLYARGYGIFGGEYWKAMPEVLGVARVSRAHTRRKASLFLEDMTCQTGGYLPGYLLVKTLWHEACRASSLFHDSDFFLQCLRAHLFDDWVLVDLMFDGSKKDISAIDPIRQYFGSRLRAFLEVTVQGDAPREFETLLEKNEPHVMVVRTSAIAIDIPFAAVDLSKEAERGRAGLKQVLESLFSETGDDWTNLLLQQDVRELALRSVIDLGRAALEVRESATGSSLFAADSYLGTVSAAALDRPLKSGAVEAEFVLLQGDARLCLLLTRESESYACIPIGGFDISSDLREVLSQRAERSALHSLSQELIDDALEQCDIGGDLDIIREHMQNVVEEWFLPLAVLNVELSKVPDILSACRHGGLYKVFGSDRGLLMDMAVASLCVPSPFTFADVEAFHSWSAGSPLASIMEINRVVLDQLGFEPFLFHEENLLPVSFL